MGIEFLAMKTQPFTSSVRWGAPVHRPITPNAGTIRQALLRHGSEPLQQLQHLREEHLELDLMLGT